MRLVAPARLFLLAFFGARVNKENWDKRLLIINLEALGDLVSFTSVLKHYKNRFPNKRIFLLVKEGLGAEDVIPGGMVDEIFTLKYKRFSVDPFYGVAFISSLRGIGFEKVINHDFSASEPHGKVIAVNLGAGKAIGYEGSGLEFILPFDSLQLHTLRYLADKVYPKYTDLIPAISRGMPEADCLPSAFNHYVAIYEGATGFREKEYAPVLVVGEKDKNTALATLEQGGLSAGEKYAVVNLSAGWAARLWPIDRFVRVVRLLKDFGFTPVLVGSPSEKRLGKYFAQEYADRVVNLIGKTTIGELIAVIEQSSLVLTNETSTAHFAVALKKPSVCITGNGHLGRLSLYGYRDINKWVYKKVNCLHDNWRCLITAPPGKPSPCIDAVTVDSVIETTEGLLEYLDTAQSVPIEKFSPTFCGSTATEEIRSTQKRSALKVVYAGIESENYNSARRPSFEYANFYHSLKNLPNVQVVEYPYESVITLGRKRFNGRFLTLIKNEKPDLFFAFMLSDEFEKRTLDEVRKVTKSVAWFADDHWRLWNYSRQYAPHFSHAVTTWSKAPETYAGFGIKNVIRSQWAANTILWKPLELAKDIDVSFVGQRTAERERVVSALRSAGIEVYVRGWGWPEGRVSREEMLRITSRSKICLNINDAPSRFSMRSLGRLFFTRSCDKIVPSFRMVDNFRIWMRLGTPQIKARPFELAASGAFVISGYADDIENYYKSGQEMIFYRSTQDLVEKIEYYLNRPEERERIARAGYERTVREHTYENRFRELFRKIGLNL